MEKHNVLFKVLPFGAARIRRGCDRGGGSDALGGQGSEYDRFERHFYGNIHLIIASTSTDTDIRRRQNGIGWNPNAVIVVRVGLCRRPLDDEPSCRHASRRR